MDEMTVIRKVVSGITINTDTAHCFHTDVKVITEQINGLLKHRNIVQGLFTNQEGQYFLAFWNKPNWDTESLSYHYIDDVQLIDVEHARQWLRNYCPEKLDSFMASMADADNPASMQTLTLRLSTELRNHLSFCAKVADQSLNKLCLNLIYVGMSANQSRSLVSPPQPHRINMPNGKPAIDKFEKAMKFEDPDEQALAQHAETLFSLHRFNFPAFLPYVLHTLYKLVHINKDQSHVLCFVTWLTEFHRVTYEDSLEYHRRNPMQSDV